MAAGPAAWKGYEDAFFGGVCAEKFWDVPNSRIKKERNLWLQQYHPDQAHVQAQLRKAQERQK